MTEHYKIEIYKNILEIKELWQKFLNKNPHFGFQTFSWLYNWEISIGNLYNYKPRYVVVYWKGEISVLMPLAIVKRYGINILTFMGGDYAAGVYTEEFLMHLQNNKFEILWKQILSLITNIQMIDFNNQPDKIGSSNNPLVKYLKNYPSFSNSNQIIFPRTWDEYYSSIKKKLRQDSIRQINRLKKLGELSFSVASTKEEIREFTKKMILQKSERYKITNKKNLFNFSEYINFYSNFNNYDYDKLQVHISALKLNDTIIAAHWGFIHNNRFYYLMPANDWGEFSKFSPGRILLLKLLQWSFEHNITVFDFTVGSEAYKKDWANQSVNLFRFIHANSIFGWLPTQIMKYHYKIKYKKINGE